ncbi:MAG: spermine/spermidine synthase domain-containing protein [Gammaproteobacteria bacterium]
MSKASPLSLRLAIALVSAGALAYELLLMRWFSMIQWHHFAFMIISLALLGFGVSGTFLSLCASRVEKSFAPALLVNLLLFAAFTPGAIALAQRIPFNAEELLWDWHQSLYLLAVYLLLMTPFFFAANSIGLTFLKYRNGIAGIYAADLIGAGIGSFGIVILLFFVFPEDAVRAVAFSGVLAALTAWWAENRASRSWFIVTALSGFLLCLFPGSWISPLYSPYKGLSQALRIPGNRLVFESSSPLGRIGVVESSITPIRHAPGLSLNASGEIPGQLAVYIDADNLSVINRIDDPGREEWLDQSTPALPYQLRHFDRVLIPDAGTGGEVLRALNHGVGRIDAVELNPAIVDLVRDRYAGFAGHLFQRDNVSVHIADGRGFVEGRAAQYDLIQLSLQDSMSGSAGLHGLKENYLYTVDSLKILLGRLRPGGFLALSLWTKIPPRDSLKLFAMGVQALREAGVRFPERQLISIRSWQTGTLLLKNGEISDSEIRHTLKFCEKLSFDPVYFPGIRAEQSNRRNRVLEDYFFLGSQALLGTQAGTFQRDYKFNIHPATDDRPYFFDFFKWRSLPEIIGSLGSGGISLLESGYLILVLALGQAILASVVLILLPLSLLRARNSFGPQAEKCGRTRVFVYFFLLGVAFMSLEIALMQKFILFLHHPLYAVTTILSALLVFAGIGSRSSQRFDSARNRKAALATCCTAIIVLGIFYTIFLNSLFVQVTAFPQIVKILLAVLLIAPLGYCMGFPFPLGLNAIASGIPSWLPWAWGINGCASVISAILATLVAVQFGFTILMGFSLLLYALAPLCFPARSANPQTKRP